MIDGRVNGMLALSRAIGDFDYKNGIPPKDAAPNWFINNHTVTALPEITIKSLSSDVEFIVLACDGIWDCKTSEKVVKYYKENLKHHDSLKTIN